MHLQLLFVKVTYLHLGQNSPSPSHAPSRNDKIGLSYSQYWCVKIQVLQDYVVRCRGLYILNTLCGAFV